jgi:hypothetical protein
VTGVLYAKVNGQWVPVEFSGKDEVWVGADDPGIDSSYEVWYDTDDDGPQYGNYAQGVTNLGVFNISNGQAMATSGNILFATVNNFYYTSGRRYRLFVELNAGVANATLGNGYLTLYVDGTAQAGGLWLTYPPGVHQHFSFEFFMEKYGMSAGLHNIQLYFTHASGGQITLHTDNGTVEMRDVGPSNPMNPLTQTTPAPWYQLAFSTGWSNYGAPFNKGSYRRLGDEVFLRGLVQQGAGAGGTVCLLPTGYRPAGQNIQALLSSAGMVRYDIQTDGYFTTQATISAGNWICLDNIHFSVTGGPA